MKKILFALACTLALTACTGNQYTILVEMPDADGNELVLINYDGGDTLATTVVADGAAQFTGTVDGSMMGRILYPGGRTTFIIQPGTTKVTYTEEGVDISGSSLTDKMLSTDADETSPEALIALYEDNKDNAFGWWALYNYFTTGEFTAPEIEAVLESAPEAYLQSPRMKHLIEAAKNAEATAVGMPFTDFSVKTDDGIMVNLSDYLNPAAYTIVDFWASWCGPCRRETKVLKEILEQHKGKNLEVLGVACWDKPDDTKAAIAQLDLPWPQIINAQYIASDLYGFNSIPHIMIVAPDGTIVARGLLGDELKAKVNELLGE